MQNFVNIQSTETLANSRQEILNNDMTIMSCSSGTSFPTTNLLVGMLCLRTDLNQLFQLKDLGPTWVLVFDLNKVFVDKDYVNTQDAAKVSSSQVVTTPTANKILQMDANGNLPANITGNAATASAVAWGNVTGKPAAFTPPVASASNLGGVIVGSGISVDGTGAISVSIPAAFNYNNSATFSASTQAGLSPATTTPNIGSTSAWTFTTLNVPSGSGVPAGTYTLQSVLQNLVNRSHTHSTTGVGFNCNCCTNGTCFLAGVKVLMADYSWKNIEDVEIGDLVIGLDGVNKVVNLVRPQLGDQRSIMRFTDDSLAFSSEHLFWIRKDGREYFGTHDFNQYAREKENGIVDVTGARLPYGVDLDPIVITGAADFAHVEGWRTQRAVVAREYGSDTQLYTLVVDRTHTFIANGYVVEGVVRGRYDSVSWQGVKC